jgi:hypothetical protein
VTVAICMVTGGAIAGCGSDDDGGDTQRFCTRVAANTEAIVRPPLVTDDDIENTLDTYRDLAELAPISIEEEWRDLLVNIETASTMVPDDPESLQRTVAVAYATERSAVAVHDWVLANCGVDLGPVATIAPQGPAATTTLPVGISTSIVTVAPPAPVAPDTSPTTLPVVAPPTAVPTATTAATD